MGERSIGAFVRPSSDRHPGGVIQEVDLVHVDPFDPQAGASFQVGHQLDATVRVDELNPFSVSQIEVLWASPNPGFEVDIDPGSNLRVEFESDDHRSRFDATWAGGPQHEIREDDR